MAHDQMQHMQTRCDMNRMAEQQACDACTALQAWLSCHSSMLLDAALEEMLLGSKTVDQRFWLVTARLTCIGILFAHNQLLP